MILNSSDPLPLIPLLYFNNFRVCFLSVGARHANLIVLNLGTRVVEAASLNRAIIHSIHPISVD